MAHRAFIDDFHSKIGFETSKTVPPMSSSKQKSGTPSTSDANQPKNVITEASLAKLRLSDFGLLHGALVGAGASGAIVSGATHQQYKGTKGYNAAHTVGVGLKREGKFR